MINIRKLVFSMIVVVSCLCNSHASERILVEAESFTEKGGWKTDQQFDHIMGSSYLLAHGMGRPVQNTKTTVT